MKLFRLPRSGDIWAVILLAAGFLVYHLPVTLGQRVFSEGDILWGNFPIRAELTRALAQGRLPLWTPLLQAGLPLFAEGHTAALYPLNLFLHSLIPSYFAISYVIMFNLVWVSIGMYFFARACGLRVSSSILAGLAFGTSGAVTARVSHLDVLTPISWLPWLMFFQVKYWLARQNGRKAHYWFILSCLSIGLQFLSGSPAIIALNLIVYAVSGLFAGVLWADSFKLDRSFLAAALSRRFAESVLVTVGSIALGVGLGAAQLLPTAELIGFSIRGKDLGRAFFTSYSLAPSALTQFISPFAYLGTPSADNMEFWGYFGVLPLMLALAAPLLRRDFRTWFFVVFAVLSLSLAIGGSNPLYDWLYYVPLINRFRVPARYLFLFLFASVFLAAIGFDVLQDRLSDCDKKKRVCALVALVFSVAILGTIILAYSRDAESWMDAWQWLPAALTALSVGILLVVRSLKLSRQTFQVLVIGLSVLDLAMFSAPFLSTLDRTSLPSDFAQTPRTVLAMDSKEPVSRSLVIKFPSVTQAAIRATLWSGLPMAYGRAGVIRGYNPFDLALQRNEDYIQDMSLAMRNLMNIRYYLLPLETAPLGEPSPFDEKEPEDGLTLELLRDQPSISPTRVAQLRLVSYTDRTAELADGFLVGEIDLTLDNESHQILPIRLGVETADWAYDGIAQISKATHSKPSEAVSFSAYLRSVGHEFSGQKYVARFEVGSPTVPLVVTAISVRSFLPGAGLTIEHIDLIDESGNAVSLSALLHRNDLALAFRSDTAAMWDNRDVLPRAFMVHNAEIVKDEQTLARMRQADFQPDQVVLLSDDQIASATTGEAGENGKDEVEIPDYEPERVVVKVNAANAGYLVLADSWYPGWEALVDGERVPIYRADYIFRAIHLQAGDHTVVFEYHPASFAIGAAISGSSLLICAGLAVFAYRRSKRANSIAPTLSA